MSLYAHAPRRLMRSSAFVILSLLALVLLLSVSAAPTFAQDISPQAIISGSLQQGTWYEQWDQAGTIYCPNNTSRYVTITSEPFTLTAPFNEDVLSIAYQTSRITLTLGRSSVGTYVATTDRNWYIHVIEVTRISTTQMSVSSRFLAKDGGCTLSNRATWSFTGVTPPPPPPPSGCTLYPASVTVNKRLGPGLNFSILGQLLPGQSAAVIGTSFDVQGRRWWQLADTTWVSSRVTIVQGVCPS